MKGKRLTLPFIFGLGPSPLLADAGPAVSSGVATLDLTKVFHGSPIIYSVLLSLSIFAFVLWLYSAITLRMGDMLPVPFLHQLRQQLSEGRVEAALQTCKQDDSFSAGIIASGLAARRRGIDGMIEALQSEGRRRGAALWQRIGLLNDVAIIAPMLGLLGTVLGMFFAFYDTNRTDESLTAIFDGLGIAIGTTVAGLVVAILAMVFFATLKFRVITLLGHIENEALELLQLVDTPESQQAPRQS